MLCSNLFLVMVFMACTLCSPIKGSATDQQATDCQGTECYFDPDYLNPGIVNVKFPENLTEVVMALLPLIPNMMGKHEQQIQNLTTAVEKMATVVETLLQSQLAILSERLPIPPSSCSSSSPSPSESTSPPPTIIPSPPPRDCQEIADAGSRQSGVYTITPQDGLGSSQVYCDLDTESEGWIVFQKRFDGSVDFSLGWDDYKTGFGSADGEFWAGLNLIHRLTQSGHWQLRIDLEAFDGDTAFALYDSFYVGDASTNYRLTIDSYSGSAGDSLSFNTNTAFSTIDRTNVQSIPTITGGWWYTSGNYHTNLNGQYLGPTGTSCCSGTVWYLLKRMHSLKSTQMKMRRV